jgi:hypothetical protein
VLDTESHLSETLKQVQRDGKRSFRHEEPSDDGEICLKNSSSNLSIKFKKTTLSTLGSWVLIPVFCPFFAKIAKTEQSS